MKNEDNNRQPILIYGPGNNGRVAAEEVQWDPLCRYKIIGFVDDNPDLKYRRICGYKVWGARGDLPVFLAQHEVGHLLGSTPQIDTKHLAEELLARGVTPTKYLMQISWHLIENDLGSGKLTILRH